MSREIGPLTGQIIVTVKKNTGDATRTNKGNVFVELLSPTEGSNTLGYSAKYLQYDAVSFSWVVIFDISTAGTYLIRVTAPDNDNVPLPNGYTVTDNPNIINKVYHILNTAQSHPIDINF